MPRTIAETKRPSYETLQTAAERTGFSTKTLRRAIAEGRLPAYRYGGHAIRVRPDDVDALFVRIPAAQA